VGSPVSAGGGGVGHCLSHPVVDVVGRHQSKDPVALEQVVDVLDVGEMDFHRARLEVAQEGDQHLPGRVVDVPDRERSRTTQATGCGAAATRSSTRWRKRSALAKKRVPSKR